MVAKGFLWISWICGNLKKENKQFSSVFGNLEWNMSTSNTGFLLEKLVNEGSVRWKLFKTFRMDNQRIYECIKAFSYKYPGYHHELKTVPDNSK